MQLRVYGTIPRDKKHGGKNIGKKKKDERNIVSVDSGIWSLQHPQDMHVSES